MKKHISYIILGCLFAFTIVMQACKREKNVEPEPLAVERFYPNSGKGGTIVTIEGAGFTGRKQMGISFAGKEAALVSVQQNRIVVQAPAEGLTGTITLTDGARTVDVGNYTYQALSLRQVSPANGPAGSHIRITGEGFGSTESPAVVKINDKVANVVSASDTLLVAEVPADAGSGAVSVEVDGKSSTGPVFRYQAITAVKPLTGGAGTRVVIKGIGFEAVAANNQVDFNGLAATVLEATAEQLVVTAPAGLKTGPLSVSINGQKISGPAFTVVPFPEISTVTPLSGPAGQVMTIEGVNFSIIADENVVTINGKPVPVSAATANTLTLTIPGNTGDGAVKLAVNDQAVTGPVFKDQTLGITKMTPDNGLAGTSVTITGTGFSAQPAENIVLFNGQPGIITAVNAEGTALTVTAPAALTTGKIKVSRGTLTAESPSTFRRAGMLTLIGGPGSAALPSNINSIVADSKGNVFAAVAFGYILKITPDGVSTVFAGKVGETGSANGTGTEARFSYPSGITIDAQDNLYVGDGFDVRKITPAAVVTTLVTLSNRIGNVAIDRNNNIYATQSYNGITRIYPSGAQERATALGINDPCRPAIDANGAIYFTFDEYDPTTIRLNKDNTQTRMFRISGYEDGPINSAQVSYGASAFYFDAQGRMLIMDKYNFAIRRVDFSSGQVSSPMRLEPLSGFADGSFMEARMSVIKDITMDRQGNIYLLDPNNKAIRKVFLE
ncbi:IPT/TIG domain-containing protein [Chitinophaga sp. 22620]|uniref:IPT/TIG domain-containing protein n=1 Tax=Chitinophaga sp. 22620 TaxID=3453952 RepID=UPI003F83FC16